MCPRSTSPTRKESTISNKIFVGNLNFATTEQDLANVLADAGRVVRVHIGTDRETGRSRGFAFAEFESDSVAADAIRRFDGFELGGRRLRVNDADDRPPARSAPVARPSAAPQFAPAPLEGFGDAFSGDGGLGRGGRTLRGKGSRRGLRGRKRSLGGY